MANAIAIAGSVPGEFSAEQKALLKRTICRDATDDEFALFLAQCLRTGLDPFDKQIYFRKYKGYNGKPDTITIITGIDGYRLTAQRTNEYEGQEGPLWCGPDGQWRDVWLADEPPAAAKVGVWRKGARVPVWGIATWKEYFPQVDKEQFMWRKMPSNQLAKCAEALALRKAFSKELSGVYTKEELDQAEEPAYTPPSKPAPAPKVEAAPPPASAPQSTAPAAPKAAEPMIDDPKRVALVGALRARMLDPVPRGLDWHWKHAEMWLRKYFGVDRTIKLSLGQAQDCDLLLNARLANDLEAYKRLLEMFHAEGRVLTPEAGDVS